MKLLTSFFIIGVVVGLHADQIDVAPDGSGSHRDHHGAQYTPSSSWFQKAPTASQLDPGTGKALMAGLSKKKTSDIILYPTPRK